MSAWGKSALGDRTETKDAGSPKPLQTRNTAHSGAAPSPRANLTPETHPSGQAASPVCGSSCARPQAAIPAVSENHPPVDRLLGGQHCGWLSEIRSEVSAPALMAPRYLGTIRKVSSLLFSGSGGLGLRLEALRIFRAFHLRPPSLATAGSARTRQGTLGSLDSPSAAASSDGKPFRLEAKAQAVTTTAQRRQFEPA